MTGHRPSVFLTVALLLLALALGGHVWAGGSSCLVFCRGGVAGLADAEAALVAAELAVSVKDNLLFVSYGEGPILYVSYEHGAHVAEEARELGAGTQSSGRLASCDARFIIEFDDLEAVLDEANTLIEVQRVLQELNPGAVFFNAWNGRVWSESPPKSRSDLTVERTARVMAHSRLSIRVLGGPQWPGAF